MIIWNPWHGCHKISEGCAHCYMYFLDGKRGTRMTCNGCSDCGACDEKKTTPK